MNPSIDLQGCIVSEFQVAFERRVRQIAREEARAHQTRADDDWIDQIHSPLGRELHCELVRSGALPPARCTAASWSGERTSTHTSNHTPSSPGPRTTRPRPQRNGHWRESAQGELRGELRASSSGDSPGRQARGPVPPMSRALSGRRRVVVLLVGRKGTAHRCCPRDREVAA
jgi:hypothetical protein